MFLLQFVKCPRDLSRPRLRNRSLRLLRQQRTEGDVFACVSAKLLVPLAAGDRAEALVMGLDRGEFLLDDSVVNRLAVDHQWHAASSAAAPRLAMRFRRQVANELDPTRLFRD